MGTWKGVIGASFTPDKFDQYCHLLHWLQWQPSFVTVHNTATPSLAQRPHGLTKEHILGLEKYCRDEQGWSAGPHLFVDGRPTWVFTPPTVSGVHSPSWNKLALGVEMLGNYETEGFDTGCGANMQASTVAALATLHAVLGLGPATLRLHKEDPATTHKGCPGKNVSKSRLIEQVQRKLVERHAGEHLGRPS